MTIIFQSPERIFNPNQPLDGFVTINELATRIKVTATRVNWPVGPIGTITVTRPDGSFGGSCSFVGGIALARDGVTVLPASFGVWQMPSQADGPPAPLPLGAWFFDVTMVTQVRSAVTVEVL